MQAAPINAGPSTAVDVEAEVSKFGFAWDKIDVTAVISAQGVEPFDDFTPQTIPMVPKSTADLSSQRVRFQLPGGSTTMPTCVYQLNATVTARYRNPRSGGATDSMTRTRVLGSGSQLIPRIPFDPNLRKQPVAAGFTTDLWVELACAVAQVTTITLTINNNSASATFASGGQTTQVMVLPQQTRSNTAQFTPVGAGDFDISASAPIPGSDPNPRTESLNRKICVFLNDVTPADELCARSSDSIHE